MKENENILDEETGLRFNLTNIDGNHGYYILGIAIGTKNSDDGRLSEDDAKKAAHERCKEIIEKKEKKIIYLFDKNHPSILAGIRILAEERGIHMEHIENLSTYLDPDDIYPVLINPLSDRAIQHWEHLKEYIPTLTKRKVIIIVPDFEVDQMEKIIEKMEHVTVLGASELKNMYPLYEKILDLF